MTFKVGDAKGETVVDAAFSRYRIQGLRPIRSRVALDVVTLLGLAAAAVTPFQDGYLNVVALLACICLTLWTAGLTNRWPISFPMVPLVLLQASRRLLLLAGGQPKHPQWWWLLRTLVGALSGLCILLAATLSVLFPAVELPPVSGPYYVGVVDFYLPVKLPSAATAGDDNDKSDLTSGSSRSSTSSTSSEISNVHPDLPVRVFYPTQQAPDGKVRHYLYLKPRTAKEFCRQLMLFGAPPFLRRMDWLMHTWRLTELTSAQVNAPLLPASPPSSSSNAARRLPVVVYSHGLAGTSDLYSFQAMSLAAHGYVVVLLNHQDGSALVVPRSDGTLLQYNSELIQLWKNGDELEYVRARRQQTETRALELIAAVEALVHTTDETTGADHIPELAKAGLSFRQRLDPGNVVYMGHSFGGSTAVTAAKRRPDLVRALVLHEPAVDWIPDDVRRDLFDPNRLDGLSHSYNGGTGGLQDDAKGADGDGSSNNSVRDGAAVVAATAPPFTIHDLDLLFLYSDQWHQAKWGGADAIEAMHASGKLGRPGGPSSFGVMEGAKHNEFSDTGLLTPVWLARATGITGTRDPLETALDIQQRTRRFVQALSN